MSLAARRARLIEEVAGAGGPHDRLQAIVERVSELPGVDPRERTAERRVHGCASAVWITGSARDGLVHLAASADAPLVAGLVRLTCEQAHGATVAEVLRADLDLLAPLGLDRRLSATRVRGLARVRERIRAIAAGGA